MTGRQRPNDHGHACLAKRFNTRPFGRPFSEGRASACSHRSRTRCFLGKVYGGSWGRDTSRFWWKRLSLFLDVNPPGLCGRHPGRSGHALEILRRTAPDGIVIGMDWDEDALCEAREALKPFEHRTKIFRENFVNLPDILSLLKIDRVDGILFDVGLSSIQLDEGVRGFS